MKKMLGILFVLLWSCSANAQALFQQAMQGVRDEKIFETLGFLTAEIQSKGSSAYVTEADFSSYPELKRLLNLDHSDIQISSDGQHIYLIFKNFPARLCMRLTQSGQMSNVLLNNYPINSTESLQICSEQPEDLTLSF